jgi:hypothetical protein
MFAVLAQQGAERYWPDAEGPVLERLARFGPARAREILVRVEEGASTKSVAIFAVRGKRLVRVTIPGAETRDTLTYGGSGNISFAANCLSLRRALLAASSLSMQGSQADVVRTIYRFEDARLRVVSRRTYHGAVSRLRTFPEFQGAAFSRCS